MLDVSGMSYRNVEQNILYYEWQDFRRTMHPDDRAWLERVEAPLRAHGWEPPLWVDPGPLNYNG